MKKLPVALIIAASTLLAGCSQSLQGTDPDGFEACTRLDKVRDKSTDGKLAADYLIFGVGEKAVTAKTEAIRNGVEEMPELSALGVAKAYSIKDGLAQTCKDLGVSVRDVSK